MKMKCDSCDGNGVVGGLGLAQRCSVCGGSGGVDSKPDTADRRVSVSYKNHRGEIGVRTIVPGSMFFGSTQWHPEPQWLMNAFDVDKREQRTFAMADFHWPSWQKPALASVPEHGVKS